MESRERSGSVRDRTHSIEEQMTSSGGDGGGEGGGASQRSNILASICFVLGIKKLDQVRVDRLQELVYKQGQAGITKASVTIFFNNEDTERSPIGYEQFDQLTVTIWSVLLSGSLNFLTVICAKEYLPIGTNHVFVQELKTLYDAEKVLKQEKYAQYMKHGILDQRGRAERILEEIINRAPQLLDL